VLYPRRQNSSCPLLWESQNQLTQHRLNNSILQIVSLHDNEWLTKVMVYKSAMKSIHSFNCSYKF
jgi:hypothetical protein